MKGAQASRELPDADLPPCLVGIVFAMGLEAAAFERRLAGAIRIKGRECVFRQGGLHGKSVVVARSGIGRQPAAKTTELLIEGHRPRWVISAGLAGGLQPGIQHGDIVMADAVVLEDGRRFDIDLHFPPQERRASPGMHVGALLTIDRVAARASDKRDLGQRHGALAVDMETFAVAEACRRLRQPFLAVRALSDAVDEELPPEIERLINKRTIVRQIGSAAGTFLRRPSIVKDLWRFRESASDCADRLAGFLDGVVKQLAAVEPERASEK